MEENRITEQSSAYDNLQRMSVHDILTGINREDARVHEAVRATIPVMERLVEQVVGRMAAGGRMFYIGAGTSGRLGVTDASELPPTYGIPFDRVIGLIAGGDGALRRAVEHAEDDFEGAWRDMALWHPTAGDVLVGIAASGTTPYVVGGLQRARREGPSDRSRGLQSRLTGCRRRGVCARGGRRTGVCHRLDPHEGGYGTETDAQHAFDGRDDPTRAGRGQPDGAHAAYERQARRARHPDGRRGRGAHRR